MRIYTRTGDAGETSLHSGERVLKDSPRMCAIGAVDEAQAALGLARSLLPEAERECAEALTQAQRDLSALMAELAAREGAARVTSAEVANLEACVDRFSARLPEGFSFCVPGDDPPSAALHVARTVVRRAEREVVALSRVEPVGEQALAYLNRLSDLCYVLARLEEPQDSRA